MAEVSPQQRSQELQFLLRMLTERGAIPPPAAAEARSYPVGNWFRPSWEPSAADAINLSMAVLGPKAPRSGFVGTPVSKLPISPKPSEAGKWLDVENDPYTPESVINPATGKYHTIPRRGTPVTATPQEIIRQTKEKGGYTVNLETGEVPSTGIMAGKFANADPRTRVINGDPTMVDVTDWIKQNEKVLKGSVAEKQGHHVGTWKDTSTGKTYLDVSKRFEPTQIRPATKFAEKTKQISMYNIGTGEQPPVGDYPGFVSGRNTPAGAIPYSQRLSEMGQEGAGYLSQHPTANWWETPDIQRVYGPGREPQIAGFMAATSTNTKPPPNVQGMSEYMRRYIRGEPIVQPEFRVPQTALGGFAGPGSKVGLETGKGGRQFNLEAAARGDLAAMRGEVVREKTQALTGDPLAMVLDRIHVRLTEAPAHGVYATPKEGVTPVGPDREVIKDAMAKQAAIEGKNPRQFSAEVWTGIREHIKRTGELYGTKYPGTQAGTRGSESKSYNDLFVDLVKRKADKLGISIGEMEKRLRSGDAELLSHLLAVPAVASLYKLSRGSQGEVVPPPGNVAP